MAESLMSRFVSQLESEETKLLYVAINQFGDDQHPWADEDTVRFFNIGYAAYCLGKHFQANPKSDEIIELYESTLNKLLSLTNDLEVQN